MKNLLCWESEDIKNLKLNARKVDEANQLKPETRKLLEKIMEPDFKVYTHFKDKFWKEVINFGDLEMREELADLDRVNTEITEKCDFKEADNSKLSGKFKWWGPAKLVGYMVRTVKLLKPLNPKYFRLKVRMTTWMKSAN